MYMRLDFGLTGMPGSGKTTSGDYLERNHSFVQFCGSDFLQQQAFNQGLTLASRAEFSAFYRQQRALRGAGFIAEQSLSMPGDRVANVGIRTPADVDRFLEAGGILLGIVCGLRNRFERTAGTSPKYPRDIEDFIAADQLENSDDGLMNVQYALDNATHLIDSNGEIGRLYEQLDDIVDLYRPGQQR